MRGLGTVVRIGQAVSLVLALVAGQAGEAQEPTGVHLGIDHFGLEEGLPGMYIPDLALTTDGQLWLSASGRLVSFDGLEFQDHDLSVFRSADRTLRGLAAGRADTLWVTVGDRLFSYVRGEPCEAISAASTGRSVWQVGDTIWAWGEAGAFRVRGGAEELVLRLVPGWHLGQTDPLSLEAPGNLWLHKPDQGSVRRFNARQVLDPLPFPEAWPLPDPERRTIVSRVGPELTEVTRLDGSLVTRIPRELGDWPIFVDSRGLVWLRTPGAAVALGPEGELAHALPLAEGAVVASVVEDREGNLWLGTVTHGLYRIRPLPVLTMGAAEGVTDSQVLRVSSGPSGSVLALHADGGLTRMGEDTVERILEPSGSDRVFGAVADRGGTIWVSLLHGARGRLVGFRPDGGKIELPVDPVGLFLVDPTEEGALWVLREGLVKIRPYDEGSPVVAGPFLDRGWGLRDMIAGSDGSVWVTGQGGLAHITDGGVEVVHRAEEPRASGRALFLDAEGAIWIGSALDGLTRYKNGTFRRITRQDGLWDKGTSTILPDDAGNLWMSSNRGVHRVSLREANAFLDGDISRVNGVGYGPGSGFQNPETSGYPGYRDPEGRLWFPTFSGVARLDPARVIALDQATPGIRIRGVHTERSRFAPDSVVNLPRGERRADIAYGAIFLTGHNGMRYEVQLDGVDEGWVDAGTLRQVAYGNLPPGRRVFRARAVSGAGIPSAEAATIALVVPAYFHETRGFALLMAMLAGAAFWLVYHLRIRQLRGREIELQGIVDNRTRELQGALAQVETQATELRSLDQAKSRFFANVSHELRTPLTLVQGPLQDVLDGRLGPTPAPVREQVGIVLASGRRLGELVEQLLDVARLEAAELRLEPRRDELAPLFARLAHAFAALAHRRGIVFTADVPDGSIVATLDFDQMEKVWTNLLSNAMKFTPRGGCVAFTVAADGPDLVVAVDDDGPGIPAGEIARIFERFHQVDASPSRAHGGTGLGLALVKEVTELHGGSVEVRSEPERGSRFVVRVPADPVITSERVSERSPSVIDPPLPVPSKPESLPGDDAARRTILVVEDHDDLRSYLRRHLEDRYRVVEAANGRLGLEMARTSVPDLILCDIMMPEMDGEALCREVRADPELAYLPVVMITARWSRESRLSALQGGADDYLVKPFDPEELRLRIDNLFASRQRLAQRLREEGAVLPFIELPRLRDGGDRDFAARLGSVLREHVGDEEFDVDAMARALFMSRATLYRKVDEVMGTSPKEALWSYRLEQAAHWLRETDATVSEVAYGAGFKTVPHFTRRFRERFGSTPAAWRKTR